MLAGHIEKKKKELWYQLPSVVMLVAVLTISAPFFVMMTSPREPGIVLAAVMVMLAVATLFLVVSILRRKGRRLSLALDELFVAPQDSISLDGKALRLHSPEVAGFKYLRDITTEGFDLVSVDEIRMAVLWVHLSDAKTLGHKVVGLFWQRTGGINETYLYQDFFSEPIERLLEALTSAGVPVRVAWSQPSQNDLTRDLRRMAEGKPTAYILRQDDYRPGTIYNLHEYYAKWKIGN
jgi:hypothetical protein